MNKRSKVLSTVQDSDDMSRPQQPGRSADRSVDGLTQLHDLFARRAVERLIHGLPWETYQELANDVEERLSRHLSVEEHGRWVDQALLREAGWFHVEGQSADCELCLRAAA
jgi:hypothetical protein